MVAHSVTIMPKRPPRNPPSGSDPALRRGEKGRRILDAAIQVFAEKGFYTATVAEVARRAGVADGTIYLYFKGKDDLLIRLFEEKMAEINSMLRESVAGMDSAAEKLRTAAAAQMALVVREPDFAEVICVELRQSAKFMKEYENPGFKNYLAFLAEIVAEGQASGELRSTVPPMAAARALFGALDELSLSWLLARKQRFDLEAVSKEVTEAFVRGLVAR